MPKANVTRMIGAIMDSLTDLGDFEAPFTAGELLDAGFDRTDIAPARTEGLIELVNPDGANGLPYDRRSYRLTAKAFALFAPPPASQTDEDRVFLQGLADANGGEVWLDEADGTIHPPARVAYPVMPYINGTTLLRPSDHHRRGRGTIVLRPRMRSTRRG